MSAPTNTPSPYASLVQADKLALLFDQSFPALFHSLCIGGLMCWSLWGSMPATSLWIWLGMLGVSSTIRLLMYLRYFRMRPSGLALLEWQWPYFLTLALSASIWGFGALWLIGQCDETAQLLILFFIVGMAGGGVVTYSAHRGMTLTATLLLMAPSTLWLYTQPGHAARGMALAGTVLMLGAVRATKVLSTAMHEHLETSYKLNAAHAIAEKLAHSDDLTGINNRRAFMKLGESMAKLSHRNNSSISCLVIDVDHFKQINDRYGHSAGDRVLQHIGALLTQEFRTSDVCGRLGGEEFSVVLPETESAGAAAVAEHFRKKVAESKIHWQDIPIRVTVSIGVSSGTDLTELLYHADIAMYDAKTSGRNRVMCQVKGSA
jgi:diguanylate cyclase (GGDEF)-like protein